MVDRWRPAYTRLTRSGLRDRAARAVSLLGDCRLCPRDCGVDRLSDRWSACKTGRHAVVSSCFPHFGEEDCLRGRHGSGTIFFAHCNLRCVFCQNYDISQGVRPEPASGIPPEALAGLMLELQSRGCHNINFVTPEHVVPQILEALVPAVESGLSLPLVYNTSAYDSLESMELMSGVVDVYMPDFKLWSDERSGTWLKAADYPDTARAAIRAMHDQVGPLRLDANGLARRGVLVRHLMMPGCPDETESILRWLADELGPDTYVNLMDQYRPGGKVDGRRYPELNRGIDRAEYRRASELAQSLGLRLDHRSMRRV
jgi:putative pyruvate formate lyase activating enzyme